LQKKKIVPSALPVPLGHCGGGGWGGMKRKEMTIRVNILFFKCPTFHRRKISLGNLPSRYIKNFLIMLYAPISNI